MPYHESVPPPSDAFAIGEEWCRVVRKHFVELLEAIWDAHLAEFVPNGKDYSFMDRRWGRDHFLGASRASRAGRDTGARLQRLLSRPVSARFG